MVGTESRSMVRRGKSPGGRRWGGWLPRWDLRPRRSARRSTGDSSRAGCGTRFSCRPATRACCSNRSRAAEHAAGGESMHRGPLVDRGGWTVGGGAPRRRPVLGTAGYPSPSVLRDAIRASETQVVTVGLKRTLASGSDNGFVAIVREALAERDARLLPNTAGCRSAREAIELAMMARELYETAWIKLEGVGGEYTLQPDPGEPVRAAGLL